MASNLTAFVLDRFTTFGDLLRCLRRRVGLTQRELGIAVGYSEAQISRLELNQRQPDPATIAARFVPILDLADEPAAAARLLDLAHQAQPQDLTASEIPPYKGLNSFDVADADAFFGREAVTQQLVADVLACAGTAPGPRPARWVAIVGASGSGKSSVVRAGLIPALRRQPESADWPVHVVTPGAHPLRALAASLAPQPLNGGQDSDLAAALAGAARRCGAAHALLVVDQLEELFVHCRDPAEQGAFVRSLLAAASAPDGIALVVIVLRADFYADCARFEGLREVLAAGHAHLGPMTAAELRRAIEAPAAAGGWALEPGLAEVCLQAVGADDLDGPEPGALPLLSHALLETWRRRRGRTLTLSGYAAAGGVRGAVAATAEAVFNDQLNADQRRIARQILLRLIAPGEGHPARDTRRRVATTELLPPVSDAPARQAVLETLAEARLLTLDEAAVEIAHEALIQAWPRLRTWLDEARDSLRLRRQLAEAAAEWRALERDPSLLYSGPRLTHLQAWTAELEQAELNAQEREFLEASRAQADQAAADQAARHRRELEAARQLAESERQRAEEHVQAARRLRWHALALSGALVLALGLGGLAAYFGSEAAEHTRAAQLAVRLAYAREVAASAEASLAADPERSLLLALEALSTTYTVDGTLLPEAEAALHHALAASRVRRTFTAAGAVAHLTLSPDGAYLAAAGPAGTPQVWAAATGAVVFTAPVSTRFPGPLTADARLLALTEAADGQAVLAAWTIPTGQAAPRRTLPVRYAALKAAAFSADGRFVAFWPAERGAVWVWDVARHELLAAVASTLAPVISLGFTPDGRTLAVAGGGRLELWALPEGVRRLALPAVTGEAGALAFSPGGDRLATGGPQPGWVHVWDTVTGRALQLLRGPAGSLTSLAFSPDGARLAAAGSGGEAGLWEWPSGQQLAVLAGHRGAIPQTLFSPEGRWLITAGVDATIRYWETGPLDEGPAVAMCADGLPVMAAAPSGRAAVVCRSAPAEVALWDLAAGQRLRVWPVGLAVTRLALSPDGKRLAVAGAGPGAGALWAAADGRPVAALSPPAGVALTAFAFSPDSLWLAAAGSDGAVRVWNTSTGGLRATLPGHAGPPWALAASPDAMRLAVLDPRGAVALWDTQTAQWQAALTPGCRPAALSFAPEARTAPLAVGCQDGAVEVWEPAAGRLRATLTGLTEPVSALAISPDGTRLAASGGGQLQVWEIGPGQAPLTLVSGENPVLVLGISAEGARLWMADSAGRVRVFLNQPADLLALARQRVTRPLTSAECRQYLHHACAELNP